MELGGQYEGKRATLHDLLAAMGFRLMAVLVVLVAQFGRF